MKIIVIGNHSSIGEFKNKFSAIIDKINSKSEESSGNPDPKEVTSYSDIIFFHDYDNLDEKLLKKGAIIFDFYLDESLENFDLYKNYDNLIIFGNLPKSSLAEIHFLTGGYKPVLFGYNGLPGMFNRQYLEVSVSSEEHHEILKKVCKALGTEYLVVADRVGMVTPRVACMIINEAYFTIQEGTANKADIDIAMKLGTNYPYGPFEWCKLIGIGNVYELLEALYEDTKDERYKICPLLKKEYLLG